MGIVIGISVEDQTFELDLIDMAQCNKQVIHANIFLTRNKVADLA